MRSRLRERTIIAAVVVATLGFASAGIALAERGVDAGDMLLPMTLAAIATIVGLAWALAMGLRDPIRTLIWLRQATEGMTAGALDQRAPDFDRTEAGELATSFNEMARVLRTAFAGLEAERHRFVAVMNTTTNGVIALDRDLHCRYLNPACERVLGVRLEDALGKPFLYAIRDPELHERLLRVRETHQQDVTTQRGGPQGRELQVLLTPLAGAGDWAFLVVLTDLTEVRRLEGVRREFVSNVSHELRTPLAALRAAVETLQAGAYEDAEAAPRFFERVVDEVDRLTNLVDELLTLSRVEAREPEMLADEAVNLAEIAHETARRLTPQAERSGLTLSVEAGSAGCVISGDSEQVRRAVANLVHNAIKFTPPGGDIIISTMMIADRATIAVRDTGMGIGHEDQERIFERFFKADRSRSGEGSGLGLAIAKHIVQAHGGELMVESAPGRGSTFRCVFPRLRKSAPPAQAGP